MEPLTLTLLVLFFAPNMIAYARGHRSAHAILALNILLGWTALGWIIAMVWALTGNVKAKEKAKIW